LIALEALGDFTFLEASFQDLSVISFMFLSCSASPILLENADKLVLNFGVTSGPFPVILLE